MLLEADRLALEKGVVAAPEREGGLEAARLRGRKSKVESKRRKIT
jgi:hypothetical protein